MECLMNMEQSLETREDTNISIYQEKEHVDHVVFENLRKTFILVFSCI